MIIYYHRVPDAPTLDAIKQDFVRHGLSGYIICSFFLPYMMAVRDASGSDHGLPDVERDERVLQISELAGEDGTHKLNDIIRDIVQFNAKFR